MLILLDPFLYAALQLPSHVVFNSDGLTVLTRQLMKVSPVKRHRAVEKHVTWESLVTSFTLSIPPEPQTPTVAGCYASRANLHLGSFNVALEYSTQYITIRTVGHSLQHSAALLWSVRPHHTVINHLNHSFDTWFVFDLEPLTSTWTC